MLLIEKDKRYAYKKRPKKARFAVDTIIILLRGNSGSGKTTVAKALHQQLGAEAVLISPNTAATGIFFRIIATKVVARKRPSLWGKRHSVQEQ